MLIFLSNVIEYDASSMFSIITHITHPHKQNDKKQQKVLYRRMYQPPIYFLLLFVHYSIKRTVFSLYRYCTLKILLSPFPSFPFPFFLFPRHSPPTIKKDQKIR